MSGEFPPDIVADLTRRLGQAAPRWNLSPKVPRHVLAISENLTYLVGEPDAPRVTLQERPMTMRLHRSGYHTDAEIRSELAWINALRKDKVVETPAPRIARDGQALQILPDRHCPDGKRRAVGFDWVPGENPDPAKDDLVPWFSTLGSVTARLHVHAQAWQRPADFVRKSWTVDTILGEGALWGPWQAAKGLTDEGKDTLEQTAAEISTRLATYGQSKDVFGLIHGDLRLANLLVDEKRLQVIDFDDCGFSWFMFDFAAAISFHEDDPAVEEWCSAWVDGYEMIRPLNDSDKAILPTLVMLRRIQLTAWLASHHEIPLSLALGGTYTEGTVAMAQRYLADRAAGLDRLPLCRAAANA